MRLTTQQIQELQFAARDYILKARERFKKDFAFPVLRFDLRGTAGGVALLKQWVIRVNEQLAAENFEHYKKQTIGHEVAHLIAEKVYGSIREPYPTKIRSHGREWAGVMYLFGLPSDRCHTYDTTNSKVRTVARDYQYSCNCKVHNLTAIKHNKMLKGASYRCRLCRGVLKFGTSIGGSAIAREPRQRVTLSSLLNRHLDGIR